MVNQVEQLETLLATLAGCIRGADHLPVALRGNIKESPQEIALAFQNNLSYLLATTIFTWEHSARTTCEQSETKLQA